MQSFVHGGSSLCFCCCWAVEEVAGGFVRFRVWGFVLLYFQGRNPLCDQAVGGILVGYPNCAKPEALDPKP